MKLKNKKTGEIGELLKYKMVDELFVETSNGNYYYKSLAELNEE